MPESVDGTVDVAGSGTWAYSSLASIVNQHVEERQTSEVDAEWLKQTVKQMKTGLQQFNLQAKLKSEAVTPNAALLKLGCRRDKK